MNRSSLIESARKTLSMEAKSVAGLANQLDDNFAQACDIILQCSGRVIVTGMGKSGHIASKIAATLASTGSPASFVHPGEALHGDLGMITANDVLLALSYSGSSDEVLNILPMVKRIGIPVISMTGQTNSMLATSSDVHIAVKVNGEACPHNLAPTCSTTAALAMGDALAIALLEAREFSAEDFANSHPSGALGRKLFIRVSDLMHTEGELPRISCNASVIDALQEITAKKLGVTTVTDASENVIGIFTDGDLRRCVEAKQNLHQLTIGDVMTKNPASIHQNALAAEALKVMEDKKITSLLTRENDTSGNVIGILHMHDLLRAGIA